MNREKGTLIIQASMDLMQKVLNRDMDNTAMKIVLQGEN